MDESAAATLQSAIQSELGRRFDLDEDTMAEYVVVMIQNEKNAAEITAELTELVPNFDASFTQWLFEQVTRLQAGQPIEQSNHHNDTLDSTQSEDQNMSERENAPGTASQGMGFPNPRIYSDLKKVLSDNNTTSESNQSRHRPEAEGVRSSPYGTTKPPTGPRNNGSALKTSNSGPVRTNRHKGHRNGGSTIPEMPQFPAFPLPEMFTNMPLANRIDGSNVLNAVGFRAPSRRCTKWPTCFKGKACTFGHPTTICQNAACRKVDGTCTSVHIDEGIDLALGIEAQNRTEAEMEAKTIARANKFNQKLQKNGLLKVQAAPENDGSTPICKYGEACTNRLCHFSHPSPASKNGSSIVLHSEMCNQKMDCKDENCSYSHPSPSNKYTPGVKLNTVAADVQCRFHPCLNPSCRFQHGLGQKAAPVPAFPGARNKVWTPSTVKSTAERSYVAGDAEEQFTIGSNVHDNDTEMEK